MTALAAAVAVALSLTASPAVADICPNAALREQNSSTQLPDCRAYELVSPVFKEGFLPAPLIFNDEGVMAYISNGNYADNGLGSANASGGNSYVAVRSAGGWTTTALAPSGPAYYSSGAQVAGNGLMFSSDLRSSLWLMSRADQAEVDDLYLERPDHVFTRIGSHRNPLAPPTRAVSPPGIVASDDLSHVVFAVGANYVFPGTASATALYEYVGTGHADAPQLVSVNNAGVQIAAGSGGTDGLNAISGDGRVVVWTSAGDDDQVWARVNGTTTIAVSASECTRAPTDPDGPCSAPGPASFRGASVDGTRVYFTTAQQLVDDDTDATDDLYECDISTGPLAPVGTANSCSSLRMISGAASGANVQRVTRISDDGSRVYFVATGVLASNAGANDATAVSGDQNLYVRLRDAAHPSGETRFVAKLDPADGSLGIDGGVAQTTADGRYLVFATFAALIDHGPQADTDTAQDIYRYDAVTGALTRLSTDADGDGGNASGLNAQFSTISPQSRSPRVVMSDDGGSVVFVTAEALAPDDMNDAIDTYLWRSGRVSLISSGKPSEDHSLVVNLLGIAAGISGSGRDVYFTTTARLTPNDIDTVADIYDARVDGGFDLTVPPACVADGCQGVRSVSPSALPPNSSSAQGQGLPQTAPAFTVGRLTAGQLRRVASTGKVSLPITTNAPGTLSASATATIAKRSTSVGSGRRKVATPGSVSLTLRLSKKARSQLKTERKLTVKVLISQDNVATPRKLSLKLTQPKKAKQSSRTTSRHAVSKGGRS